MKTPNRALPFPLSYRKAHYLPYMRKVQSTRQDGTLPIKFTGLELDNIEDLQNALGTRNRQDTIRLCLNMVYASLVHRGKINTYPQLKDEYE